jgi:hypothetical protein
MATIFPWIICFTSIVGMCIVGMIVDQITKKR